MSYVQDVYEIVKKRNGNEPEFLQAVKEVFNSLEPVFEKRQDLVCLLYTSRRWPALVCSAQR